MNRPRDSKGRYVRDNYQNLIKITTNIYGGQNTPTTNWEERYWRTHIGISSTWKPKYFNKQKIERSFETKNRVKLLNFNY